MPMPNTNIRVSEPLKAEVRRVAKLNGTSLNAIAVRAFEDFVASATQGGTVIERDLGRFASGEVRCPCGESFHLYYNGGELDQHTCVCGREYRTEHRSTHLVVREPTPHD